MMMFRRGCGRGTKRARETFWWGEAMTDRTHQHQREMGHIFYDEKARIESRRKAERWTDNQARRLNTTPVVILEAVLRGWLPEQLEKVSSKYRFEDGPPPLGGVPEWIDRKIDWERSAKTGPAALAVAFHRAKAA